VPGLEVRLEPTTKRLGERRIGLDPLGLQSSLEVRDQAAAKHRVLLGTANEIVEPEPGKRELLSGANPRRWRRRERCQELSESCLVVTAHVD